MSILAKVRKDLMESGKSEAEVLANGEGIQVVFQELQELRKEKNEAKMEALRKVDADYAEAEAGLEKQYSLLMKLTARDTEK